MTNKIDNLDVFIARPADKPATALLVEKINELIKEVNLLKSRVNTL